MAKIFLVLVLFVCALLNGALGQCNTAIDSLHAVLKSLGSAARFPALYELAFKYIDSDKDSALKFCGRSKSSSSIVPR
jgi:hypothetical protein